MMTLKRTCNSHIPPEHFDRIFLFLLWFMGRRDMHGYEIIKKLRVEGFTVATPSRVYPILAGMKARGLISQKEMKQGRRVKKVYTLTQKGRQFIKTGKKAYFSGIMAEFLREMLA
jgi:DNA-binding PadR family transcriptional regulator